jgi:hypothetical protein
MLQIGKKAGRFYKNPPALIYAIMSSTASVKWMGKR